MCCRTEDGATYGNVFLMCVKSTDIKIYARELCANVPHVSGCVMRPPGGHTAPFWHHIGHRVGIVLASCWHCAGVVLVSRQLAIPAKHAFLYTYACICVCICTCAQACAHNLPACMHALLCRNTRACVYMHMFVICLHDPPLCAAPMRLQHACAK